MVKGLMSVLLVLVAVSYSFGRPDKAGSSKKENKFPQTLSRVCAAAMQACLQAASIKHKSTNKPVMVIHHLEDCPHSQALKQAFASNRKIQKMADEDFILLNLVFETTDKHLSPDGQYVPRIIFVDPSLTIRADITGRYANRLYAYEPADINLLISNMEKAKKLLKTEL
ncbi:AGR2 protein, partial [Polyodon spathula]|nr:AGR2 protein [Polyodon spathula]